MTQPVEEPLIDVTPDLALAGQARILLRHFAEAARDRDSAPNIRENYQSQLWKLVDPHRSVEAAVQPDTALLAVADRFAGETPDQGDVVAAIRDALGITDDGPLFRTAAEALNDPEPVPVLQRLGGGGAILSVGEIAVLSGEGGAGKSTLAAQLAMTSARTNEDSYDRAAGLSIQGGPVFMLSYEDRARRVADRLNAVDRHLREEHRHNGHSDKIVDDPLHRIHLADMAGWPLFGMAEGGGRWDHPRTSAGLGEDLAIHPRPRTAASVDRHRSGGRSVCGQQQRARRRARLLRRSEKRGRSAWVRNPAGGPLDQGGPGKNSNHARGGGRLGGLDRRGPRCADPGPRSADSDNPKPNDPFLLRLVKANYAARFAVQLKARTRSNGALIGFHEPKNDQAPARTSENI